MQADTSN